MKLYGGSRIVVVNEKRSIVTSSTSTDVAVKAPFRRFIEATDDSRACLKRQSDGDVPGVAGVHAAGMSGVGGHPTAGAPRHKDHLGLALALTGQCVLRWSS